MLKKITLNSIKNSKKVGKGIVITNVGIWDETKVKLSNSINEFTKIKNIYKNIPECQTNFVYSKEKTKSIKEIMGIFWKNSQSRKRHCRCKEIYHTGVQNMLQLHY